jgi:hypothetical protein
MSLRLDGGNLLLARSVLGLFEMTFFFGKWTFFPCQSLEELCKGYVAR